ncbi:MAG TPA: DUF1501 domain-containing protein [Planctomycetota bacterium]|nr:DUF1501 domain-containing protein [Planctomycetota bacterium]
MLTIERSTGARTCDGVTRRDVLRIGTLTAFGISLPSWLELEAKSGAKEERATSCILLWMNGGPSHIDSFDPKPDAPAAIRGEFKTIPTTQPGIHFTEHLPRLARRLDKFSMLRSVTSPENGHERATHDLLSGYRFTPALSYPAYGSVVVRELGDRGDMPGYVLLGGYPFGYGGAGYMGAQYNPFQVADDPNRGSFRVRDVALPNGLTMDRMERRRTLLEAVDTFQRRVEASDVSTMTAFYEKAYSLLSSPAAKRAFDLSAEPLSLRDRYGRTRFGQQCLLARRLVEAGVRFITIDMPGWDTHENNFPSHVRLLSSVDASYSALLDDLESRGLLDSTLVIWMGEFGRTPKVNPAAGRDHWARAMCVGIGGGPIQRGIVLGATDANAETPTERPITVPDLAATIYKALGIDFTKEYLTPQNRPIRINYDGVPVEELF